MRFTFDLLGPSTPAMSMVVLGIGGLSAAAGVLYAMMQQDLKRLLAYSTVENIGIIFVGIGLAMAFRASNMNFAAALALTAACFHILNHAIFKSLLFFSAGAVLHATGERDMDQLGGLIHRMPKTAIVFLVGCMAVAALPPLNGFVSEWLTFQAILVSPQISQWGPRFLIPAVGALLALSAALAAACFVKAYGIAFLGRPRSDAAANAHEVDGFSLAAMFLLAALCVLLGAIPGAVVDLISPVAQALVGARMPAQSHLPWLSLVPIAESRSSYNGLIILFFIVVSGTATALFIHRFATRATRRSDIWDCGYPDPSTSTQYGGSSFAMPIRRVFGTTVFDVREKLEFRGPGDIGAARYHVKILDPLWRFAYGPLARWVLKFTVTLNQLQFLTIRSYLTLVFATLILLLLVVAAWR
jgi:hydrogenase-4 component B